MIIDFNEVKKVEIVDEETDTVIAVITQDDILVNYPYTAIIETSDMERMN